MDTSKLLRNPYKMLGANPAMDLHPIQWVSCGGLESHPGEVVLVTFLVTLCLGTLQWISIPSRGE